MLLGWRPRRARPTVAITSSSLCGAILRVIGGELCEEKLLCAMVKRAQEEGEQEEGAGEAEDEQGVRPGSSCLVPIILKRLHASASPSEAGFGSTEDALPNREPKFPPEMTR